MATLQTTCITGFLNLCQATANLSAQGKLWFDTSDNYMKYSFNTNWAAEASMNTSHTLFAGGGTPTAALAIGNASKGRAVEEYNGTSWSTGGLVATGRDRTDSTGTQNAALIAGGNLPAPGITNTEEYNGSSWSAGGNLNVARLNNGLSGTQNAAVTFGGLFAINNTEEYNGSSWSNQSGMPAARYLFAGTGTQNSALSVGGGDTNFAYCPQVYEYNGSSWANGGNLNVAGLRHAGGTQNSTLAISGEASSAIDSCTENYNGSSWSTGITNTQPRKYGAIAANDASQILYFGSGTATESYTSTLRLAAYRLG